MCPSTVCKWRISVGVRSSSQSGGGAFGCPEGPSLCGCPARECPNSTSNLTKPAFLKDMNTFCRFLPSAQMEFRSCILSVGKWWRDMQAGLLGLHLKRQIWAKSVNNLLLGHESQKLSHGDWGVGGSSDFLDKKGWMIFTITILLQPSGPGWYGSNQILGYLWPDTLISIFWWYCRHDYWGFHVIFRQDFWSFRFIMWIWGR